jgi:hypothetical protein
MNKPLVGRPSSREQAAELAVAELIESGPYFTDGFDLFRIVGVTSGSSGPTVVGLEDCRTLEVSHYAGHALMTLRLRGISVEPAEGDHR